ncbi:MAG: hypothetical protein JW846_08500 [Dehalococcoidia bacterium]|nr:hypothetical protein [Dehalococcoidia bacterium]
MMDSHAKDFATGEGLQERSSASGPDCVDTDIELSENERRQEDAPSCSSSCRSGLDVPSGKIGEILSIGSVVLCIIFIVLGLTLGG